MAAIALTPPPCPPPMHTDPVDAFRSVMIACGLDPPLNIEAGRMHRFPSNGRAGDRAGWCLMLGDRRGGVFGDWRTGLDEVWQAQRETPYTRGEQSAFSQRCAEARAIQQAGEAKRHAAAAATAAEIWEAADPAPDDHPYLILKAIKPHGARLHNGALLIPLLADGAIRSCQIIAPDGGKRFLPGGRVSGCHFTIGSPEGAAALCIAEGFATAATIHEATSLPVFVAFNAGNLLPVARAVRAAYPDANLIICADNDHKTEGNPGLTKAKAKAAAQEVGAVVVSPVFGADTAEKATDFNDMSAVSGLGAVRDAICDWLAAHPGATPADVRALPTPASASNDWEAPQPLTTKIEPEPYPIDALPPAIRAAVEEVQAFTQAPVAMVAGCALSALAVAIQARIDAQRAEGLDGPVSLFLLTIADSGERKTTCDSYFTRAIRAYETEQADLGKPLVKEYKAKLAAWEAKVAGVKSKITQLSRDGKPTVGQERELGGLEHEKPEHPRWPSLLHGDSTLEHLAHYLAHSWPSGAVICSEGGAVLGNHGMGQESIMRNLGLLNVLWDGGVLKIGRKTAGSFTVRGARFTMALQVQEATLRSFFDKSKGLARGSGFLARFLIAWPASTQGSRIFAEPPTNWPALDGFSNRLRAILNEPAPMDDEGRLIPAMIAMLPEAKSVWVAFHNAVENELRPGGEFCDVRDVASKTADNAARIAALFHVFEKISFGQIGVDSVERAVTVAAWHLSESRRFFGELALPAELAGAARMDAWLIDHCRRGKTGTVSTREIQQHGPGDLRGVEAMRLALAGLEELGRIQVVKEGRKKLVHINPQLLNGGGL